MLRKRGGQVRLEQWKAAVQASEIAELIAFVDGLAEDAQAVSNGCSLTWSNGMVEGFINKVKSKSTCRLIPGRSMSLPFLKIFPGWSCRQRSPPPRISGTICPSWLMQIARYGPPEAIVTDSGGIFYSAQALQLYDMFGIRKERIDPGKPWQNYAEALFSILKRLVDHEFSNARTWPELELAHQDLVDSLQHGGPLCPPRAPGRAAQP